MYRRRWLLRSNRESQNAEKSRATARDFYAFWLSRTTTHWWWPTVQSWWTGADTVQIQFEKSDRNGHAPFITKTLWSHSDRSREPKRHHLLLEDIRERNEQSESNQYRGIRCTADSRRWWGYWVYHQLCNPIAVEQEATIHRQIPNRDHQHPSSRSLSFNTKHDDPFPARIQFACALFRYQCIGIAYDTRYWELLSTVNMILYR